MVLDLPDLPLLHQRQSPWLRQNQVAHEKTSTWDKGAENFDNIVVGPTVEDLPEGISLGGDGPGFEEVVLHELDAWCHGGRKSRAVDTLNSAE